MRTVKNSTSFFGNFRRRTSGAGEVNLWTAEIRSCGLGRSAPKCWSVSRRCRCWSFAELSAGIAVI